MLPTIKTILYATDLGHFAPQVFRYAVSVAHGFGAKIHIVHAVEPLGPAARHMVDVYLPEQLSPEVEEKRWEALHDSMRSRLEQFCREESCSTETGEGLIADIRVLRGNPAEVILNEAKSLPADVIVMGSHGHGTVGEVLLGSTAHRVVHKSTAPVLLVRVAEAGTEDGL